MVAVVHDNWTSKVLLAVESPVGAMHRPEFTETRLKVLVLPLTVTGWAVNSWFVWLLQVHWITWPSLAVDRPEMSTHSPANEVIV